MKITADTSVWIDYLANRQSTAVELLDKVLNDSTHELVVLDLVLMEVLRGYRYDDEWVLAKEALSALPIQATSNETIAILAADIYRNLRKKGTTIRSTVECLIAAWCRSNDCDLIADDRDFVAMATHYPLSFLTL